MSTTIDERIVSMQFDNKQFENNVQTSLSTIDKLKKSLNLTGASKGLENIESAAKKVDLSSVSNSADKVGLRFSAMYTMADQALRRITDSAMAAGERIVKSLTIDPIKMGFQEYETQMNAVQTILANTKSKGTSLDDVNGALDELNTYADKTIYNFTEMTRNIGTFTAAGVDLDTSVSAIKGIANLAAVSGSNSQQASTAMYQLSQAMASGTVKLMDWNSVVNAGMGGQVFQDALKETAKVHGVAIEDIIKKQGSFRESLSTGWLTTEILTETLSKFTGDLTAEQLKSMGYTEEQIKGIMELGEMANSAATDVKTFTQLLDTLKESAQSGWSQTWKLIFGDFEEAKQLFSQVSEVLGKIIGDSAESRNAMLEDWKVLGGRDDLIKSISNAFEALMSVITPIKEAFRDIFPPMTGERLASMTEALKEFTSKLILSDNASDNLKRTFKGLFAICDIVWKVISGLAKVLVKALGVTDELGGGILSITAKIGDWLVALNDAIESSSVFQSIFDGLGRAIAAVLGVFAKLINAFQNSFVFRAISAAVEYFINVLTGAGDAMDQMSGKMAEIKEAWEASGLYKFLSGLWKIVKSVFSGIASVIGGFVDSISEAFGSGDFEKGFDIINGLLTGGLIVGITTFIKNISGIFTSTSNFIDSITGTFGKLEEALNGFADNTQARPIRDMGIAIGILAASLLILSLLNSEQLADSLVGLSLALGEMLLAIMMVNKMAIKKPSAMADTAKTIKAMISLSVSLLILSFAIKKIGELEWETWAKGILGVSIVLIALAGAQSMLNKTANVVSKGQKVDKSATSLFKLCITLMMIARTVRKFGEMDTAQLVQGTIGMAAVLAALLTAVLAMVRINKYSKTAKYDAVARSCLFLALAINLIMPTLVALALLPLLKVLQSIGALTLILGALVGTNILLRKFGGGSFDMLKGAASLAVLASVIQMLMPTLVILAILPWNGVLQSVLGLTVVLGALAGTQIMLTRLTGSASKMTAAAESLLILAFAIRSITPTLIVLALLPLPMILQSVIAFTAILAVLSGTMLLLTKLGGGGTQLILTATSMVIMATAIMLLTTALLALSVVPLLVIVKGLVSLVAIFAVLGVSALILAPLTPILKAIGMALLAMGGAIVLVGLGTIAFAAGLIAMSAALTLLFGTLTAVSGSLSLLCNVIVELISSMIEGLILGIGKGIVAVIQVLIDSFDVIYEFLKTLILGLCDVIVECVPAIVDALLEIVVQLCASLSRVVPLIVDSLLEMLTNVLVKLAERLPDLIKAAVDVLFAFIKGVIEAFGATDPGPLLDALKNIGIIAAIMAALAAIALLTPAAMVGVLGMTAVVAELSIALAALGALASIPGLSWLIDKGAGLLESVGKAIGRFIGGLIGGIAKAASSVLPQVGSDLSAFMSNASIFIEGLEKLDASSLDGIKILANVVDQLSAIAIRDKLFGLEGSSLALFGKELESFGPSIKAYADSVAGLNVEDVKASVEAAAALSELAANLPRNGGLTSLFVGDRESIGSFGEQLVTFGKGMKAYADSVYGIDATAIKASAEAAAALSEVAANLPNSGGLTALLSGDNSLASFGKELVPFGQGLKAYADSVLSIDAAGIKASAEAAKSLADMTNAIPNSEGMVSWFTGDNSISKWSGELSSLGRGLAGFSMATAGIDPSSLTGVATAAKSLAEMTNVIPNSGGIGAWFAGEKSLSKFGGDLIALGNGLAGFALRTMGINPESIKAAASAAKSLAEMTNSIPSSEGIGAWFSGEKSISKFGTDIVSLGAGLAGFAANTAGINVESVTAAANAAKSLAEMTDSLPSENGITAWFSGEKSMSKFSADIASLGVGLKGFATNTEGINAESVTAAANAAKALAEMTEYLPNENGITSWFSGEKSVSKFAGELPVLGKGLKGFSESVQDINAENVTAAANAAKALAEMTKHIPSEGGIKAWFSGKTSISNFADKLPGLGKGLKGFSDSVQGINPENLTAASNAAKSIAEMCKTALPNVDKIPDLATNIKTLGSSMKTCFSDLGGITAESIKSANTAVSTIEKMNGVNGANIGNVATSINNVVDAIKNLSQVPKDAASNFSKALSDMGKTSTKPLVDAFKNIKTDMQTAGEDAVNSFITGLNSKKAAAEKACTSIASACAEAIKGSKDRFYNAGSNLVSGFASGISENDYKAEAKAAAMAKAAAKAAEEALDINSPSKVFRAIGYSVPEGFAMGIDRLSSLASNSATSMANDSVNNVKNAISRISSVVNSDIDSQPTIRPVLDLSDVRAGANSINSLFGTRASVGVLARVNSINSSMNQRIQNGDTAAIVNGIEKLNKQIKGMDNASYNINGVTLSGDAEVQAAFETILRAAKIERRR